MLPDFAPSSQVTSSSATVALLGAERRPRLRAASASIRQAFASLNRAKVRRTFV